MNDSYDVLGVGVPYLDIVVQVAKVPAPNQSAPISGIRFFGGGKVPTALVAASRLGLKTALVAGVAGDSFAATIREELEREGVAIAHAVAAERSAVSVVLADEATRSRTILYSESAVPATDWFDGDRAPQARLLHISAAGPAEKSAIRWAKRNRIPVMLDADYYDPALAELAADITLFIGSEHFFADWMPGCGIGEKLAAISEAGPQVVVATMGERGCMLRESGVVRHVPAFRVEAVDTTGAGDVFHGAYAVAYLNGRSAYDCAVFASAVSALKCLDVGGRAGIPRMEEVRRFLENHYDKPFHI